MTKKNRIIMIQGENIAELDFNAVQRGNAEMENKLNRVIQELFFWIASSNLIGGSSWGMTKQK